MWFVRHALGDATKEGFIQTIPRRGYRFVAHVRLLNDSTGQDGRHLISSGFRLPNHPGGANGSAAYPESLEATTVVQVRDEIRTPSARLATKETTFQPADETADAPPEASRAHGTYPAWALYAGIGAIILTAVAVWASIGEVAVPGKSSGSRIAVLPFKAVNLNHRDTGYELGITESLILRLASDKRMLVRPLSAVRTYLDRDEDPKTAGNNLKVDHVLSSNYQIADGKIRVTSQWINVQSGEVEDAFSVENEASGNFAAQDALAEAIGRRILARFGTVPMNIAVKRGTDNEEAYRLYMQGMNLSEERGIQNVEKALQYLEQSVELDPNYALAWSGIALLHRDIVGHTEKDSINHYERSMAALRNALAIDPGSSDAYSALCGNKLRYEFDMAGAEAACRKALDLDPVSPVAHKNYAFLLTSLGRFDEAIAAIKRAMDIQPVSYRNQQIYALILYFAGRHKEEEQHWKRLIELNPNHSYIFGRLSNSLKQQGKNDEAFEYFVRKLTLDKVDERSITALRAGYASSGWKGVSELRLRSNDPRVHLRTFDAACFYAVADMKDEAFEFLEKAYTERSSRLAMVRVEPQLAPLRKDPRFDDFVRKISTGK